MNKITIFTFLLSLFLISANQTNAETFKTYTPLTPQQYRFYNGIPYQNNYNYHHNHYNRKQLSNIEKNLFNENYKTENPEQRLSRIEEKIFGTVQSGNLGQRYKNIQNYMSSVNNYPYYYPKQKNSALKNILQIFSSGQITGITPTFNPPINNSNYGFQDGWADSNGNYYYNNYNMQNGMTVKILD